MCTCNVLGPVHHYEHASLLDHAGTYDLVLVCSQSSRGTPGVLRRARPEKFLILNININNRIRDTVFEVCQRACFRSSA